MHQREDGPPRIRIVTWFLRGCGRADPRTPALERVLARMKPWAESVTTGPGEVAMSITQATDARPAICTLLAHARKRATLQDRLSAALPSLGRIDGRDDPAKPKRAAS